MPASIQATLPEVASANASGITREIYDSIEGVLGVRLVNLVYRHLATVPGALEWAWSVVGQGFRDDVYRARSEALVELIDRELRVASIGGRISLAAAGLTPLQANAVRATVDAYNRANPINALCLRVISFALAEGWLPAAQKVQILASRPLMELLPMGGLDDLDGETSEALTRLAHYATGETSRLVPSLFRHFIPWPDLLAALCEWLAPLHEEDVVSRLSDRLSTKADVIARDIFNKLETSDDFVEAPKPEIRDALSSTIRQFLPAICRMIVIGGLLRRSIEAD